MEVIFYSLFYYIVAWLPKLVYSLLLNLVRVFISVLKLKFEKNGFRGDCQSEVSDVSSLDLYTFFSINSDAYKTLKTLQNRLKDKKD